MCFLANCGLLKPKKLLSIHKVFFKLEIKKYITVWWLISAISLFGYFGGESQNPLMFCIKETSRLGCWDPHYTYIRGKV